METKTTSKTSCLKALLIKAWRERWSDVQWGINIKTVLPRGVSGDVYNLADCILQQAVVGAGANQLVLSYLKHSLSSQLVSHAAVLQRLAKYSQMSKVHCVYSLLEFLEGMLPGVTCCGKPEETQLATAIISITSWLLSVLQHTCSAAYVPLPAADIKEKASDLLKVILQDNFYISMLCLARYSDPDLYTETCQIASDLENNLSESKNEDCLKYVHKILRLNIDMLQLDIENESWPGSLVQFWLEVKLVGNLATSTASLADQLRLFARLKGYKESRLYAELIRGSFMALHNVSQTPHESQWGAFAYLKVPHVIAELGGRPDTVMGAIELLLQHDPHLDTMDAHSPCSSLECLLIDMKKANLLTEEQVKQLIEKRKTHPNRKVDAVSPPVGFPNVVSCAGASLDGILKMMTADEPKIQKAVQGMLLQAGKTFELIVAVATVQGQLRTLVKLLILFNECSKSAGVGDCDKAQLFDITFLMLVAIVQMYGVDVVLEADGGDSLFEQWVRNCMVERSRPKAPDQLLQLGDPTIVEALLQQFNSGDTEVKGSFTMQGVLFSMAGVMREVLVAWEQGVLLPADVKRILEAVRGRMCCLPLAAAAWLCAFMRTAPQDTLLKPVNMVQQLMAVPNFEDESLKVAWQLTCNIIRQMQRDVQLPIQTKGGSQLVSRQPATEQLHAAWTSAINRGWLDHSSTQTLHCLLDTAGARWLVAAVVQELMILKCRGYFEKVADLALAIFHVNIVDCTLELLSHVLPELLYNDLQADTAVNPQLFALATLTSYCIYTAWDSLSSEEPDEPPAKKAREENTPSERILLSLRQLFSMFENCIHEGFSTPQTYFSFYLIKCMVQVKPTSGGPVLATIPPALVSDLIKTLPHLFEYALLANLHDVTTPSGRTNMARDLCMLRTHHLRSNSNVEDDPKVEKLRFIFAASS